jgi:Ca-activated chloride channel family protein
MPARSHALRTASLSALALLTALPVPLGPAAARTDPAIEDGAPTAEACSRYGFQLEQPERSFQPLRGRPKSTTRFYAAPIAAPPPPPPPPPPSPHVAPSQNVVVTGSRITAAAPYAGATETERYPNAPINAARRTAEDPVSTFSIDVDTTSYANVRRFLSDGQLPPRDAVRVEEMVNYFDYGYPAPASAQEPFRPFVAVAPSPWSRGKQIVHIGLQGYDIPRSARPPLNLVFLVDVSGSMDEPDRLPLAIKALNLLVDQLRPQDRVSLVVYAGAAGVVLQPTMGWEKLKMRCALGALHAGGSTAGGQGLALAYAMAERHFDKGAVNRVVLMTDGDFNVGVADPRKLQDFVAEKRATGVYLSAYGYGRGNYNDVMMQSLAQAGNGTAGYVDTLDEARKLFREDFARSIFPIADDVKIQVEFNPARVAEYRLIGYETRLLQREDFNNDKVDAGEVGAGASVTALYEITPTGGPLSSDPLRYGKAAAEPTGPAASEIAFLKIRYKLPGQHESRLIERPISGQDETARLDLAPASTRWALAVAAFGQRLRGDPHLADGFGWSEVQALAQGARGEDAYGLRRQFIELASAAGRAKSVNEPQ